MKLKLAATLAVTSLGALSLFAQTSSVAAPKAEKKEAAAAPRGMAFSL